MSSWPNDAFDGGPDWTGWAARRHANGWHDSDPDGVRQADPDDAGVPVCTCDARPCQACLAWCDRLDRSMDDGSDPGPMPVRQLVECDTCGQADCPWETCAVCDDSRCAGKSFDLEFGGMRCSESGMAYCAEHNDSIWAAHRTDRSALANRNLDPWAQVRADHWSDAMGGMDYPF